MFLCVCVCVDDFVFFPKMTLANYNQFNIVFQGLQNLWKSIFNFCHKYWLSKELNDIICNDIHVYSWKLI